MAEYGILVWRDTKTGDKQIPPEEYDIFIDLDETISPQTTTEDALQKYSSSEKIFKNVGTIDTLSYQTAFSTYKTTGLTKRETSETVMPTFIDRCITRLSEKRKQEPLEIAVERAKWDPRRHNVGYEYVSNGFYAIQASHSKVLLKKNALQTLTVDRISMCSTRPHISGVERLYSQMMSLKLLETKMGKIYKASRLVNLSTEVGSEPAHLFILEFKPFKLSVQALTADEDEESNIFAELEESENANIAKRKIHLMEGSEGTDLKMYYDDLVEEVKDGFNDRKITAPLILYGKLSKYHPELRIVIWKMTNISTTKATLSKVSMWKDTTRLPSRFKGIFAVMVSCLNEIFEDVDSPENVKMVNQPTTEHNPFWLRWWNDYCYRKQDLAEKRMKTIYGDRDPGCVMEKCILVNYLEVCGFLYNLIGRNSSLAVRHNLYPQLFKRTLNGISKVTEERKRQIINEERKACDQYLENNFIFDDWDDQLLKRIRESNSIPAAFVYILRIAGGDPLGDFDPDDIESDMNLVILGKMELESFLEYYTPFLSRICGKALTLNGRATIGDMLHLLTSQNLLYVLLALFGDVSFLHHRTAGYVIFKRFKKDRYLLTHIFPSKSRTHYPQGVNLCDFLLHMTSSFTCEEFLYQYHDPFEGLEQEKWIEAWDAYQEEAKKQIEDDKVKYGEKAEQWALEQTAKVEKRRKEALYRWTLRDLMNRCFQDDIFGGNRRALQIQTQETIHRLRINYVEMSLLMASQCKGFTDVITICYPVTSPHRSIIVVTLYSYVLPLDEAIASIMRRFPRNFENIYQHVMVQVGLNEVRYTTKTARASTSDRLRVKGLGPMQVKTYPYTVLGVDAKAIIVKHSGAKRGSPFFFVKIASAD
uniref:VP3 n=1 Tax=Middle Point orbivirus TaxID=464979 RepID=A0A8K1I305_9REOV|nr:VP3 [Middle Point orbivirus]